MKFTESQINAIVNLTGHDGKLINVFDLHGILYVGNTQKNERGKEEWDITKTYVRLGEHSLPISLSDFEDCKTPWEVEEKFATLFKEIVVSELLG